MKQPIETRSSHARPHKQEIRKAETPHHAAAEQRAQTPTPPKKTPGIREGIAFIGHFYTWPWGQYPDEAYLADAFEDLGAPVYRIDEKTAQNVQMDTEWAVFTGHSCSHLDRWRATHKTVLWTLDWLPHYPERDHVIEAAKKAHLFASSDQFDWAKVYGIGHHLYLPAACETPPVLYKPTPEIPCAFVGALYNDRRKEIAQIVEGHGGRVLSRPGLWIYGNELSKFCQATKVIVGDNYRNDVQGYWSSRNYIIPGAGGFLLTPEVPGLGDQLEARKHIDTYRSLDELREKLPAWIKNDPAREEIRRSGFLHVREYHSWIRRASALIRRMTGVKA